MSKRAFLIYLLFFWMVPTAFSFASVSINEISILPTDGRFIELYNNSPSEVDLTGFYLQRKTSTGNSFGSLVSSTHFENKKIPANGFFLISRSALTGADIVLSSLTLTESNTIQLKNSDGEVVSQWCWGEAVCTGLSINQDPKEGESVSLVSGILTISSPTPKKANEAIDSSSEASPLSVTSNSSESNNGASSVPETKNNKLNLKVEMPEYAFARQPVELYAQAFDPYGQKIVYGKYFWNFGDGTALETLSGVGEKFTHTFSYPGEYKILVEYHQNPYLNNPDITRILNLKIIDAEVVISRVGTAEDFFVEIANESLRDVDLSGWSVRTPEKIFTFPRATILGAKQKIILSSSITGFTFLDKDALQIFDKYNSLVFETKKQKIITTNSSMGSVVTFSKTNPNLVKANSQPALKTDLAKEKREDAVSAVEEALNINKEVDLSANAKDSSVDINRSVYWLIMLGVLAGASALVLAIRRRGRESLPGDDFEILEE